MKNVKCGVYKITNTVNGKFYIGSSKNIDKRWNEHIWELNNLKYSNTWLQRDWIEYGQDSFNFEIVEECAEEDRYSLEQDYLDDLKPFYNTGKGYNIKKEVIDSTYNPWDNILNKKWALNTYKYLKEFIVDEDSPTIQDLELFKKLQQENENE